VLEKWAAFGTRIGYPDKSRDRTGLATRRDCFQPVDENEWGLTGW